MSPTVTGSVTSYSVSPALPAGLSLNISTGVISGTPTSDSPATSYVVTAENSEGSTTFTLSIAVLIPAPSALSYPSPQIYYVGSPIVTISPTVTGLVTRYGVAPALPAGLALDPVTGQISGTPSTAAPKASYIITASNGTGQTAFSLTLAVLIPPPSFLTYPSPQTWIQGTPITPISPSVNGLVTLYQVAPALPAGLSLQPTTGQIAGTPTAAAAASAYIVTASNSSGSTTFPLWITVLVPPPTGLSYPSPQTFTAGTPIGALSPTLTGTATSWYSTPGLPAGLLLDPASGRITGTPAAATPTAAYVITAANTTGSTTFTLTITVRIAAPSALSYHSPQTYYVGTAITPLAPSVTGTVASYGVSPALPAGLTIDTSSGVISGTPTTAATAASYIITATNSTGSTTFALSITVMLLPPTSLSYPSPQSFAVGTPIIPLNPFVVGVVSTYSVLPALPAGLALNGLTGQIAGTPTAPTTAATYTITAANAAGSTTFGLSISVVTVGVTPAQISRLVAQATPVVVQLVVQSTALTGPLYIKASDSYGLFNPAVTAAASTGSGYAASLTTSTAIAAGHYSGSVTLSLCKDAACATPQSPSSVALPFDVRVLSATSAWPGNNEPPLAAWSGVADWTMFQGNAAHTGYVPVSVDPNSFTTRWQGGPSLNNTPNNYNGAFAYTLTTDADQLYIGIGTTLYALKELDASQVWSYPVTLQFPSVNPPAEANGTVYMAGGQQSSTYLFAFDETNGSIVFQSPMSSQWEHYFAPTIGPKGVYTNAGTYGGMFGFNFSGTELFFENLAQVSQWTPAVDANSVYSYTGVLTVADPVTGTVTATIQDPSNQINTFIDGSPVLGAAGSVFATVYSNAYVNGGGLTNTLVDFEVTTQSITWQLTGDYGYNPAYNAGVLYAVNNQPLRLEARSETDGSLLWSWTPPQAGDNTFESEVLLTSSIIFVSTNLATYGIDAVTHQLVFSYPFPGRLALSHNGILYIQGVGPIVAINVK